MCEWIWKHRSLEEDSAFGSYSKMTTQVRIVNERGKRQDVILYKCQFWSAEKGTSDEKMTCER